MAEPLNEIFALSLVPLALAVGSEMAHTSGPRTAEVVVSFDCLDFHARLDQAARNCPGGVALTNST